MTVNDPSVGDLNRSREVSVTEHLRNSIYTNLFREQETDNCPCISLDLNWGDNCGLEEY